MLYLPAGEADLLPRCFFMWSPRGWSQDSRPLLEPSSLHCAKPRRLPASVRTSRLTFGQTLLQRLKLSALQTSPRFAEVPAFASDLLTADNIFPAHHHFLKVKAHENPGTVPAEQLLPTLGNAFADEAAKLARKTDLPLLADLTGAVAEWRAQEAEDMYIFCQYQIELAMWVKPLRHTASTTDDQGSETVDFEAFQQRWTELATAADPAVLPFSAPAPGGDIDSKLCAWLEQLTWPDPTGSLHKYSGITYLELLANCVLVTGYLPPRTTKDELTKQRVYLDLTSSQGILQPANLREMLAAFALTLTGAFKQCSRNMNDCKHRRIRSLEYLGLSTARKGLLRRPAMPQERATCGLVWQLLTSSSPGELLRDAALRALV